MVFILLFFLTLLQCIGIEGFETEPRIFGGQLVPKKEDFKFRWLVAFHNRLADHFFCAGSLISAAHVLSTAHCFHEKNEVEKLSSQEVLCKIGQYNLSTHNEDGATTSLVWDILIHPDWDFRDSKYKSDIALVVLQDEIIFNKAIKPVRLSTFSLDIDSGVGTIAGWGKSSTHNRHDDTPSTLEIPIVNITHCMMKSTGLANSLSYSVFCGGYYEESKGPCTGDSGGGLYIMSKESSQWEVCGIISMSLNDGINGCDPNNFAFYTNVGRFGDWITEVVAGTKAKVWTSADFECETSTNIREVETDCKPTKPLPATRSLKIRVNNTELAASTLNLLISLSAKVPQIIQEIGTTFPNLKSLTVKSGHNFKSVERSDFGGMRNLRNLILYGNKVGVFADDALHDLKKLQRLNLDDCGLRIIPKNFFSELVELNYLSLIRNSLQTLSDDSFQNLGRMHDLNLSENPIKQITKNLFKHNFHLKLFFCTNCQLKKIGVDFTAFGKIKVFLEDNECIDEIYTTDKNYDAMNTVDTLEDLQNVINENCV